MNAQNDTLAGPAIDAGEPLLKRKETANQFKVSVETIKNWQARGLLKEHTVGGKLVRYFAKDVEAFIAGRE